MNVSSHTVETVTVGFNQTSYSASEDGPLNVQVCAEISNLQGDLECNLVVTFNAVSNSTSGKIVHVVVFFLCVCVCVCVCFVAM